MFFKETTTTAKYSIMNEFPTTTPTSSKQNTLLMTPNTVKSIEESILASLEAASYNNLPPTTTTPTTSSTIIIPSTASGSFVPPLPQQQQQQQQPTIILANNWHGASVNYKSETFDDEEEYEEPPKVVKKTRGKKPVAKQQQQKKRGRRSVKEEGHEDLSDRRTIRRERNKLAAARCRKRRVDHTNALLEETLSLEDTRSSLQQQIASLQQKKEEFEFLLQAHTPSCILEQKPSLVAVAQRQDSTIKEKKPPQTMGLGLNGIKPQRPTTLPMVTNSNNASDNCPISITTPSNGLWTPSIDGLIESWSTGMTPVVGGALVSSGSTSLMTPVVTPGGGVSKFVVL